MRWFFKNKAQLAIDRICGRTTAHFLHLGKTGGTSIKKAFENIETGSGFRLKLHGHEFTIDDVPAGDKFFFFVRDPITRFVSGFYSRQNQGFPRYDSPWSPTESAAFALFSTADELGRGLSQGVKEATKAMRTIQHVRDSYWKWCVDEQTLSERWDDILFVGTQENLDSDFAELTTLLGVDARLPTDSVDSHRNTAEVDRSLSQQSVDALKKWYQRDYELIDLLSRNFNLYEFEQS